MKDILFKLGESELKWPTGLREYIYNETDYQRTNKCKTYYVDTLELWRGKLLMRTFAYCVPNTNDRPYKMEIQEVCRRLEGEKEILLCQIEKRTMAGRIVYFTDDGKWVTEKGSRTYYHWYRGDKKNWWFYEYEMFDKKEWMQRLGIPYCGYDSPNYKYKMPFFQYVELYKKYPKIELLAKAGWGDLISGARYFNFNGKSFEQIFKIPKYWKDHLHEISVSDILLIRKHKMASMVELEVIKDAKYYHREYIIKYMNKKMIDYIDNYNKCTGFPFMEYNDYLRMAERLGYQLERLNVLCPEDGVIKAHDKILEKYEMVKDEIFVKGIVKTAEKLMKYKFENKELIIFPAASNEDLIKESEELEHCVRTYAEDVSSGKTGIMFIRKKEEQDKPFVTLELKGKRVIQVRGYKNNVRDPLDKNVINFVKQWEKKYNLEGY